MSVRKGLMEIEAYMALAGLGAIRNVQIHARRGLIQFVRVGTTRRVQVTVKGEAHLVSRGRITGGATKTSQSLRVPKKLIRLNGTEGLPVVRSWRDAAAWLGVSEPTLRERKVGFILIEEKTFPLVSSVEALKQDIAP